MIDPYLDPRTEDTLAYDLVRTARDGQSEVVGRATFRGGRSTVEAPEAVKVAVDELMARSFVDRVEADERPRGYRRTGRGTVTMLVTGMPEHFMARMRGLWLPYPDGTVITARPAPGASLPAVTTPESTDVGPPVTDAVIRRATLAGAETTLGTRPLILSHPPDTGIRPVTAEAPAPRGPLSRSDCGWLV